MVVVTASLRCQPKDGTDRQFSFTFSRRMARGGTGQYALLPLRLRSRRALGRDCINITLRLGESRLASAGRRCTKEFKQVDTVARSNLRGQLAAFEAQSSL